MVLTALILFIASLVGVVGLFTLKYWETARGVVLAPALRRMADEKAIELKYFLERCRAASNQVAPFAVKLMRVIIHDLALAFAAFAREAEKQSYRLADLVSHKHRFERRETRSQFLKDVSDFKNGPALEK